ncbi:MAG: hypothetical protein JKY34_10870 [Kordiimonadaceae bacterium]|nr:hypothetical protein [Kordiimonadaceae bacterium]
MTNQPERWHLKREVSAGHLVTTAAILISGFMWASSVDTRIAVLETKIEATEADFSEIRRSLQRIEDKLDNKADK